MAIRVLLVEDSLVILAILKLMLMSSPEIEVVGEARTGVEALTMLIKVKPDVMCTDLHMPYMSGLELTSRVMASRPLPILVISSAVRKEDTDNVFQLLQAGAVDVFPKPHGGLSADFETVQAELIDKIKTVANAKLFSHTHSLSQSPNLPVSPLSSHQPLKIITIGASTGGPEALSKIFTKLPSHLAVPIICVLHISDGFLQGFVEWLRGDCPLPIIIPGYGEYPQPGKIYFPREGMHLLLDLRGRFTYSQQEKVAGHRPSISVTFNSVAEFYGEGTMGILLTGMGKDGVEGLKTISQVGGVTIAQDEASCVVFGMPKAAIALGVVNQVLSIEEIPRKIILGNRALEIGH